MARISIKSPVGILLSMFYFLLGFVYAQDNTALTNATSGATYFFGENGVNLTVSLTAASDSGDVFFVMAAPAGYDWISFGLGNQMKGAIMFVVYATENSSSIVMSPRRGSGNYEPAYDSTIEAFLVDNPNVPSQVNSTAGEDIVFSAICRKCANLVDPPLDLTSTTAPFMWAVGPMNMGTGMRQYNVLNAPLRKHSIHATFTMDMTVAAVASNPNDEIPTLGTQTKGASLQANIVSETDYQSPIHGIALILAFVFVVPADAILRMCIRSAKVHILSMAIMTILALVGFPLAFTTSALFVRSRKYTDPHQVIGLFIMIFFIGNFVAGILSYRSLRKVKAAHQTSNPPLPHKRLDAGHRYFGWFVVLLAIINVGLGFNLSLTPLYARYWIPIVIGIFVLFAVAYGTRWMITRHRTDAQEDADYQRKYAEAIAQAQAQAQAAQSWEGSQQQPPPRYEQSIPLQNLAPAQAPYESVPIPHRY